jgi:hypothetical protein
VGQRAAWLKQVVVRVIDRSEVSNTAVIAYLYVFGRNNRGALVDEDPRADFQATAPIGADLAPRDSAAQGQAPSNSDISITMKDGQQAVANRSGRLKSPKPEQHAAHGGLGQQSRELIHRPWIKARR